MVNVTYGEEMKVDVTEEGNSFCGVWKAVADARSTWDLGNDARTFKPFAN